MSKINVRRAAAAFDKLWEQVARNREKEFGVLRDKCSQNGYSLFRTDIASESITYFAVKAGAVWHLKNLPAVRRFTLKVAKA